MRKLSQKIMCAHIQDRVKNIIFKVKNIYIVINYNECFLRNKKRGKEN